MKLLCWLILAIAVEGSVWAQNSWIVQKEKDGIKISNRRSATSAFNDVRVELDLPGNLDQLAAILLDVKKYREWAYATKEAFVVKQMGPNKLIYYSEIEVPWPATNRYFYAGFEIKKDPAGHSMQVVSTSIPFEAPVPKDLVKVTYSKGEWNVTTISKKSIHVNYTLELDPGGTLPAWVLNLFSTKGPLETFQNIRKKMIALNP